MYTFCFLRLFISGTLHPKTLPWDLAVSVKERWEQRLYWCCALQNREWKLDIAISALEVLKRSISVTGAFEGCTSKSFWLWRAVPICALYTGGRSWFLLPKWRYWTVLAVRSQKRNLVVDGSLILNFACCSTKKFNKRLSIKKGSENKSVSAVLWPLSVLYQDS